MPLPLLVFHFCRLVIRFQRGYTISTVLEVEERSRQLHETFLSGMRLLNLVSANEQSSVKRHALCEEDRWGRANLAITRRRDAFRRDRILQLITSRNGFGNIQRFG